MKKNEFKNPININDCVDGELYIIITEELPLYRDFGLMSKMNNEEFMCAWWDLEGSEQRSLGGDPIRKYKISDHDWHAQIYPLTPSNLSLFNNLSAVS